MDKALTGLTDLGHPLLAYIRFDFIPRRLNKASHLLAKLSYILSWDGVPTRLRGCVGLSLTDAFFPL